MPNHFHLVLKPQNAEDLSKFMQWLLTSYVRYYNQIYKTSGHLWQGRYKSFIVQQNNYLLVLCRYIEQNPKRAKLKNWKFVTSRYMQSGLIDNLPIKVPESWEEVQKNHSTLERKKI